MAKKTEVDFIGKKPGRGKVAEPYTFTVKGHINREDIPQAAEERGYSFVRLLAVRRYESGKDTVYE